MRNFLVLAVGLGLGAASCAAQEHAELLEMNHLLFTTQMMSRDPSYLLEHSDETYVVVGPGGVVEDRDQVIAGLRAFVGVDSVVVSRERVHGGGDVAIVTNRLDVHGEIALPITRLGGLTVTTTYRRDRDRWVALSRVSTPCNPIAEERGLC